MPTKKTPAPRLAPKENKENNDDKDAERIGSMFNEVATIEGEYAAHSLHASLDVFETSHEYGQMAKVYEGDPQAFMRAAMIAICMLSETSPDASFKRGIARGLQVACEVRGMADSTDAWIRNIQTRLALIEQDDDTGCDCGEGDNE